MEHSTDNPPLSAAQQCVVDALAAGSALTDAAEAYGIHRVTVYRWMKNCKPFAAALHRARAEFVLARRDNPKSSPAVLLRTAMFILQRPQLPKTGWSMPEPAPDPDGEKLLDSAIIEQDYANLPGLCNIETDDPAETEVPAESAAYEPPPPADVTPRNTMQHDSQVCDDVAPSAPDVLKARNDERKYLELLEMSLSIEKTPVLKFTASR